MAGAAAGATYTYTPGTYSYLQEPYFYDYTDPRLRQYET
jgi:hypothetical protein